MPVRTVVEEFCDVCFSQDDRETVAADRLRFSWQGRDYILLLCSEHVGPIRDELQRLSELANPESSTRRSSVAPARQSRLGTGGRAANKTAFSQLSPEDKARFRKWADLPNARRISDTRVQAWESAGRP